MNSWYTRQEEFKQWNKLPVYFIGRSKAFTMYTNSLVEAWGGQLKPFLELPAQIYHIKLFAPTFEELSDPGVENVSWTAANKLVTRTPLKLELWSFCFALVSIMLELHARMRTISSRYVMKSDSIHLWTIGTRKNKNSHRQLELQLTLSFDTS